MPQPRFPAWVVLADEGLARVLMLRREGHDLEPVDELRDAAAHARNADLRRDAHGRRAAGGASANSTESAGEEKLDHEAESFARTLADYLARAAREGRYARLIIACAPRFLGRLRKQLDPQVGARIERTLDKDLLQLDRRTLTEKFFPPEEAA